MSFIREPLDRSLDGPRSLSAGEQIETELELKILEMENKTR